MDDVIDSNLVSNLRAGFAARLRAITFLAVGGLAFGGCAPSASIGPAASATPPTYSESVLADHPVGYWPMDEASGTAMVDASSHHHNGSYEGTVKLRQPGPIGAADAAIALDGARAWATVPDAGSFQLNTVSLELWLSKRTDVEFGAYLTKNFTSGGGLGSSWFQLLNSHHDGRLEFRVTADYPALTSTAILPINTWYYVVATYDGSTARLYINGKLDSSTTVSALPRQAPDPILIGRRGDGLFNDALISQVAIYPSALSADRVAAHWQAAARGR